MSRPWRAAALLSVVAIAGASAMVGATPATLRLADAKGPPLAWWSVEQAPAHWRAPGVLARAARWNVGRAGVEWTTLPLAGTGEAHAITLVVARLDPRRVQLVLAWGVDPSSARPAWTLDAAPNHAVLAVNAGMFADALPWGWVVSHGAELLPPGRGPLSSAVVVGDDGVVELIPGDSIALRRARGSVREAFQTYPTLLTGDGDVPEPLRAGAMIDRTHRDARLAIGSDREGRVLIVLTRLATDLPYLDRIPVGLTVPEMAAVMGSLGAARAALLDGGISAQLRVTGANGEYHDWPGTRRVPLALVARPR
jgi:hypothetical protein